MIRVLELIFRIDVLAIHNLEIIIIFITYDVDDTTFVLKTTPGRLYYSLWKYCYAIYT